MDQERSRIDLLDSRLAMVATVSALTADALKLAQALAGAEMEVLRLELEIGRNGSNPQLVRDLLEAEASAETLRVRHAECDGRIAEAEAAVADIDRAISGAGSR